MGSLDTFPHTAADGRTVAVRSAGFAAGDATTAAPTPCGYVAAADVGGTRIRMMLAGDDGAPVARWNTHIPEAAKQPRGVLGLLRVGVEAMLATVPAAPLRHLTVGAPGITDAERGIVLAAPNLPGWTAVPLRDLLESSFGVAAAVDNDTNLAALGEGAAGAAHGVANYVFVAMGTGVGAGIVLNGRLLRGANGAAGEIGYLQPAGMPRTAIRMDRMGALEQRIGGLGIEAHWREALLVVGHPEDDTLRNLRAPQIFDRAATGDTLAQEVLHWTAELLADALRTLTLVLDPALVVLGGGVGAHGGLCAAVTALLAHGNFPGPQVRSSALGTEAQLHGAVAVSLAALAGVPLGASAHRC